MGREYLKKENGGMLKIYLKSIGIGVAVTALLTVVFALVMLWFHVGRSFAAPFASVCVGAGAWVAAFCAARRISERGYLIGLIVGGIFFATVTLAALAVNRDGLSRNTLFHFIIVMLSALIGGVFGVNKNSSKKYI